MSVRKEGARRGRRVSFMAEIAKRAAERPDSIAGLRFTVETAHGGTALIDLVDVRPRRLALAFSSAHAATVSYSLTAPVPGVNDVANFTGSATDSCNVNDGVWVSSGVLPTRTKPLGAVSKWFFIASF